MKKKIAAVVAAGFLATAGIEEAAAEVESSPQVLTNAQMRAVAEVQKETLDEVAEGESEWLNNHFLLLANIDSSEPFMLDDILIEY